MVTLLCELFLFINLHFNFSGKAAVAQLLLENGANVNAVSSENLKKRSPLHEAALYGII